MPKRSRVDIRAFSYIFDQESSVRTIKLDTQKLADEKVEDIFASALKKDNIAAHYYCPCDPNSGKVIGVLPLPSKDSLRKILPWILDNNYGYFWLCVKSQLSLSLPVLDGEATEDEESDTDENNEQEDEKKEKKPTVTQWLKAYNPFNSDNESMERWWETDPLPTDGDYGIVLDTENFNDLEVTVEKLEIPASKEPFCFYPSEHSKGHSIRFKANAQLQFRPEFFRIIHGDRQAYVVRIESGPGKGEIFIAFASFSKICGSNILISASEIFKWENYFEDREQCIYRLSFPLFWAQKHRLVKPMYCIRLSALPEFVQICTTPREKPLKQRGRNAKCFSTDDSDILFVELLYEVLNRLNTE